jgi:hypothetical protein
MRLLALARAAWEAEGLYLRRLARARGIQAGFAAGAALFLLMLVVMLHIAVFAALVPGLGPVGAALVVAVGDALVMALLLLLASRASRDPIAMEARLVRQAAMQQLSDGAARAAVLAPLLRSQSMKKGLFGAAVTAAVVGLLSRR